MKVREGNAKIDSGLFEKLFNETVKDFGTIGITRPTESNAMINVGARRVIAGMNIAQYFMVEPLIDELLDRLPKPEAKAAFKNISKGIGLRIKEFYDEGEEENSLAIAISHNREKLRKIGIAPEQFGNYGGEWPERMKEKDER